MSSPAPAMSPGRDGVDRWLLRHLSLAVALVMASALAIRIAAIRGSYLSSDEAVHFQLVNVGSLSEVYRATLTNAHPPLFFFLLHFWRMVDSSEFFLRLLPALLGTILLWVAYRWASRLFEKPAAFFTMVLLAFSPALVALSTEVRGYTLLLLLMASALLVLERALETRSALSMALFSAFLYLVILTHYSGAWFAAAAFAYVLLRVRTERFPRRVIAAWLGFQGGAAALFAFLYRTHLVNLRGSALERSVINHAEYFFPAQESALDYLARQTQAFFRFLLGPPAAAVVGFLAVVAAILLLVLRKRAAAALLALPFLLGATGGLLGLYFYGGTRHSSHLILFAAAAIGVAAAAALRNRLWPAFLLGVFLAQVSWSSHLRSEKRDPAHMDAAIEAIRSNVPPGSLLFTDLHTGLTLSYYLGGTDFFRENPSRGLFWRSGVGGYRLIGSYEWVFSAKRFASELERLIELHRLPAGQRLWLVHVGPEIDPARVLAERFPAAAVGRRFPFGTITIVEARLP